MARQETSKNEARVIGTVLMIVGTIAAAIFARAIDKGSRNSSSHNRGTYQRRSNSGLGQHYADRHHRRHVRRRTSSYEPQYEDRDDFEVVEHVKTPLTILESYSEPKLLLTYYNVEEDAIPKKDDPWPRRNRSHQRHSDDRRGQVDGQNGTTASRQRQEQQDRHRRYPHPNESRVHDTGHDSGISEDETVVEPRQYRRSHRPRSYNDI